MFPSCWAATKACGAALQPGVCHALAKIRKEAKTSSVLRGFGHWHHGASAGKAQDESFWFFFVKKNILFLF